MGILEDLHVRVGNTFVLADFVVLELDEEPRDPLILGRPFLCTAGAIINARQGRIDLHLGDIAMKFKMNKLLKKPMIDAQSYSVEDEDHALFSQEAMIKEILTDDPLEQTLIQTKTEHNIMSVDSDGYNKMIDSAKSMEKLGADAASNHITQPRNRLDFRQLESDYRVTGGQLVAPRAGSQTDLPHHLISLCYPSEQYMFLAFICIYLVSLSLPRIIFTTRDDV